MKKILLATTAFVFSLTVMAQQKIDEVMKVNTETYNFGKIKQGTPVSTFFELKNISAKPIVVESAMPSCGCTTPETPKEPIASNQTAKLKVQYNAASMGIFNKTVTIKLAGVDETKIVHIAGEVVDAATYETVAKEQAAVQAQTQEPAKQGKAAKAAKNKKSKSGRK